MRDKKNQNQVCWIGQKVHDVGCSIGRGDFHMAENFEVHVVGIDFSVNLISFYLECAIGLSCSV